MSTISDFPNVKFKQWYAEQSAEVRSDIDREIAAAFAGKTFSRESQKYPCRKQVVDYCVANHGYEP